jgi:hypothetical protein
VPHTVSTDSCYGHVAPSALRYLGVFLNGSERCFFEQKSTTVPDTDGSSTKRICCSDNNQASGASSWGSRAVALPAFDKTFSQPNEPPPSCESYRNNFSASPPFSLERRAKQDPQSTNKRIFNYIVSYCSSGFYSFFIEASKCPFVSN